jgi:hypothetical protein
MAVGIIALRAKSKSSTQRAQRKARKNAEKANARVVCGVFGDAVFACDVGVVAIAATQER